MTEKMTDKKLPATLFREMDRLASYSPCGGEGGLMDSPLALIETSDNFLVVLTPEKSPTKDLRDQFEKASLLDEGGGKENNKVKKILEIKGNDEVIEDRPVEVEEQTPVKK